MKDLCPKCREKFDGIEIVEPATDGLGVTWSDLTVNQKRALRVFDAADETILGTGDVVQRVDQHRNDSTGYLAAALGRLRAMGLIEGTETNQYRLTNAGADLLSTDPQRDESAALVADGAGTSVYFRLDGVSIEDLESAETGHDATAAHDLADRLFHEIRRDYPDLYADLERVVPVLNEQHDPRLGTVAGGVVDDD